MCKIPQCKKSMLSRFYLLLSAHFQILKKFRRNNFLVGVKKYFLTTSRIDGPNIKCRTFEILQLVYDWYKKGWSTNTFWRNIFVFALFTFDRSERWNSSADNEKNGRAKILQSKKSSGPKMILQKKLPRKEHISG